VTPLLQYENSGKFTAVETMKTHHNKVAIARYSIATTYIISDVNLERQSNSGRYIILRIPPCTTVKALDCIPPIVIRPKVALSPTTPQ